MPITYYVIVLFDRDDEGDLKPGDGREVPSSHAAIQGARSTVTGHAGSVAFSRTGDPATGEFEDAVILAQFGEVGLNALSD